MSSLLVNKVDAELSDSIKIENPLLIFVLCAASVRLFVSLLMWHLPVREKLHFSIHKRLLSEDSPHPHRTRDNRKIRSQQKNRFHSGVKMSVKVNSNTIRLEKFSKQLLLLLFEFEDKTYPIMLRSHFIFLTQWHNIVAFAFGFLVVAHNSKRMNRDNRTCAFNRILFGLKN